MMWHRACPQDGIEPMTTNLPLVLGICVLALTQAVLPLVIFNVGFDTQAVKPPINAIPNPATPAGYAFVIWTVIFASALVFSVFQAFPSKWSDPLLMKIRGWVFVGYLAASCWMLVARFGPLWLTVPLIVIMAVCIGAAYISVLHSNGSQRDLLYWIASPSLAVYFGWLSAALFVNAADVLPGYGFNRFGLSAMWFGVGVVFCAAALASLIVWFAGFHVVYVLTLVWALAAIIVRNGLLPMPNPVSIAACASIVLLIAVSYLACRR